jgi:N-acetylglutamate synthase-like GNAT family acetyltransferase
VVRIRRITSTHPLYAQECALREDVLLRPIGYDMARFKHDFPGLEERMEHFVAVINHNSAERVVGCAALIPGEPREGSGRITQMAVNLQRQGEGIGRRLVVAVESRAFGELGLKELVCHTPLPAVHFFESIGWVMDPEVFQEAGVPHRRAVMTYPGAELSA